MIFSYFVKNPTILFEPKKFSDDSVVSVLLNSGKIFKIYLGELLVFYILL